MDISLKININEKLYLRNPEESELGKRIVQHAIILIHEIGFEAFTFKKLAAEINTTEAGVYRYFENKHRLLIYMVDWYWSWQEYRLIYQTNNIKSAKSKLKIAIHLLANRVEEDTSISHINEKLLFDIVMMEGGKAYHTHNVKEDNKNKLFKPYKDLCARVAEIIHEFNPKYKYPFSLASTIIEMAHSQNFYVQYLPSLTDLNTSKDEYKIESFLENLVFASV